MRLAALSAGAEAPRRHFNGAVHSAFRHACNIRLDDGRLLALAAWGSKRPTLHDLEIPADG